MNRTLGRLVMLALAGTALLSCGIAAADVHVGIGFGTTIGPHYPHYWHGYYGGWYGPRYYVYDPWWYYPEPVVIAPPVVVEPPVVVREYRPPAPPKEPPKDLVGEKIQAQKSELLKKLKIGDAAVRVQAAKDLEKYEGDYQVRTALEQALLSDRDAKVRQTIAEMFGRLQDKNTLRVLKQAEKADSDRAVRQAAYKAIILMEGY